MRFVVTATSRADGQVVEWVVDAADEAAATADADRRGFDVRFVSPVEPAAPPPWAVPPGATPYGTPPGPSPADWLEARAQSRRSSAQLFLVAGAIVMMLGVVATAYTYRLAVETRARSFNVYWGVIAIGLFLVFVGFLRWPRR